MGAHAAIASGDAIGSGASASNSPRVVIAQTRSSQVASRLQSLSGQDNATRGTGNGAGGDANATARVYEYGAGAWKKVPPDVN